MCCIKKKKKKKKKKKFNSLSTMSSIEESLSEAENVHSISQEVVDKIGDESMNCLFFLYSRKCIRSHVFLNLRHSNIVTRKNRRKTKAMESQIGCEFERFVISF